MICRNELNDESGHQMGRGVHSNAVLLNWIWLIEDGEM